MGKSTPKNSQRASKKKTPAHKEPPTPPKAGSRNTIRSEKGSREEQNTSKSRTDDILHTMHTLISSRAIGSTICPSEIPRRLHANDAAQYPDWRGMMDEVREEVWRAVERGEVEVTQRGSVRTLEEREGIKGPIRVRRGPKWKD